MKKECEDCYKEINEVLKKGEEIDESEFGRLHIALTDDNSLLLSDFEIEIKIRRLRTW